MKIEHTKTKPIKTPVKLPKMAEGEGFEPPVGFILRLISRRTPKPQKPLIVNPHGFLECPKKPLQMPRFYRPPTPELGATLLELLAVMAIISIVTATAAPAICKARARAKARIMASTINHHIQVSAALAEDFSDPTITGVWPEHP